MGDEIKIQDVQAENGGTLIQVDTDKGRMFIETRAIFKALNNFIQTAYEKEMLKMGYEKEDPNAPVQGLID